jgi:hypothetical protein
MQLPRVNRVENVSFNRPTAYKGNSDEREAKGKYE